MTRAVVVGAAGAVGRAFVEQFVRDGFAVTGADLRDQSALDGLTRIVADATSIDEPFRRALACADVVLLCLPEPRAIAAVPGLAAMLARGTLVVDVLSVKARFVERATSLPAGLEWLGINPLFGPDLGFSGRSIAAVPVTSGARTNRFLDLLRRWGSTVVPVSVEEHDRAMAVIQALTHSALLAFGCALLDLKYDVAASSGLRTPLHTTMLSLLARMLKGSPAVYGEIQSSNPHADRARQALMRGMARVELAVDASEPFAFERLMEDLHDLLGSELKPLSELARNSFQLAFMPDVSGL